MVELSVSYYVAIASVLLLYVFWMAALSVMRVEQVATEHTGEGAELDTAAPANCAALLLCREDPDQQCTQMESCMVCTPFLCSSLQQQRTMEEQGEACACSELGGTGLASTAAAHPCATPSPLGQTGRGARAKAAMNNHAEQFQFFAVGVLLNMVVRGPGGDSVAVRRVVGVNPKPDVIHARKHAPHAASPLPFHSWQSSQASMHWPV